jgi:hypothetical protein
MAELRWEVLMDEEDMHMSSRSGMSGVTTIRYIVYIGKTSGCYFPWKMTSFSTIRGYSQTHLVNHRTGDDSRSIGSQETRPHLAS